MVEVDANLVLIGPDGSITLLEAFKGRRARREGPTGRKSASRTIGVQQLWHFMKKHERADM